MQDGLATAPMPDGERTVTDMMMAGVVMVTEAGLLIAARGVGTNGRRCRQICRARLPGIHGVSIYTAHTNCFRGRRLDAAGTRCGTPMIRQRSPSRK